MVPTDAPPADDAIVTAGEVTVTSPESGVIELCIAAAAGPSTVAFDLHGGGGGGAVGGRESGGKRE